MTEVEADIIAGIAANVDGGCLGCVRNVYIKLKDNFPEFNWKEKILKTGAYFKPEELDD